MSDLVAQLRALLDETEHDAQDVAAVLRMVAAHRRILEMYEQLDAGLDRMVAEYARPGVRPGLAEDGMATVGGRAALLAALRALAEGYGITEDETTP